MLVKLTNELRIECDGLNFTLQRRNVAGASGKAAKHIGREYWSPEGHYSSLQQAAIAAARKGLCGDAELEVEELIAMLRQVGNQVAMACHQAPSKLKRLVRPCDRNKLDQMIQASVDDAPQI